MFDHTRTHPHGRHIRIISSWVVIAHKRIYGHIYHNQNWFLPQTSRSNRITIWINQISVQVCYIIAELDEGTCGTLLQPAFICNPRSDVWPKLVNEIILIRVSHEYGKHCINKCLRSFPKVIQDCCNMSIWNMQHSYVQSRLIIMISIIQLTHKSESRHIRLYGNKNLYFRIELSN